MKPIVIDADAPALLAQRLVGRLQRDGLVPPSGGVRGSTADQFVEALADEIHQHAVESTIRGGR